MGRCLLALWLCFPAITQAESKITNQRRASVSVDFRIVIPPRHDTRQIDNPNAPLGRGQERIVERLPDGQQRITLVWP